LTILVSSGISIHAPLQGATIKKELLVCPKCDFNPRSLAGSDDNDKAEDINIIISIHAPLQGATRDPYVGKWGRNTFQSTLPCRERLQRSCTSFTYIAYFNPRSLAGSDTGSRPDYAPGGRFQSTLPCRERQIRIRYLRECKIISIHAPLQGATFCKLYTGVFRSYFNPRSLAGSDRDKRIDELLQKRFQSTLPCRERLDLTGYLRISVTISIHAPLQGATQ